MSDLDKLFENAPDGATEIVMAEFNQELRWAKKDDVWSLVNEDWKFRHANWKTIATRPQPRKKVEDAVDFYGESFIAGEWTHIRSDKTGKMFFATGEVDSENWRDSYLVCTREEFEACVAAKAKSEPEWTHVFYGDKCKLMIDKPDADGDVVILLDNGRYSTCCGEDELVPIKPTITKAEAWDMLTKLNSKYQNMDTMTAIMTLCDEHELED